MSSARFNTASFGPPQSRNRAWIIAGLDCDVAKATSDAALFKCRTLPLSSCIAVNNKGKEAHVPQKRRKVVKNDATAKWHSGYAAACELLGGKAGRSRFEGLANSLVVDPWLTDTYRMRWTST